MLRLPKTLRRSGVDKRSCDVELLAQVVIGGR
jgi:hypothetical protein